MSSELQRQVSSIRKQHLSTASLAQGRPSLFLTASEAAGVDVSTILEAASSGLATLQQYDNRFEVYQNTLLHPSTVDLQRELKTVSENKALDTDITNLLKLLSLYALESSTHLVLEYLIRRYRVHEMNTHVLLQCMLVAHDSKIFARIVQLCKLEDSPWAFLQGVKTSGVPLPRSALVQRALKDASLLEILSQYVQSALDSAVQRGSVQYPMSAQSLQGADKILSFYAAVVIEMAEERPFDDTSIRHIYLFLVEGLKNKYASHRSQNAEFDLNILDQWRRACCMILVQLSLRTPFGKPLIKVISAALAEAFKRGAAADGNASASLMEIVSTMCILSLQHKFRATPKFLQNIIVPATFERFLSVLLTVRDSYNAAPLVTNLAIALASDLGQQYEGKPSEESLSAADVARALSQLLASGLADASAVRTVLATLIASVRKGNKSAAVAAVTGVKEVVQCVAQRFAAEFETTLQGLVASFSDDVSAGADALSTFLADVFSSAGQTHHMRASTQGAGLLLSLTSAIPLIRAQTMTDFASSVSLEAASTADVLGLVHAVVQNLLDPIAEVAAAAWNLPVIKRVACHLQGAQLLDLFQTALSFWANNCDRSPEVAGKLVAAIFAALEDSSVLQRLLAVVPTDQQKSLSGCQWVFLAVVPAALGCYALRMQPHTARTAQWEALAASATRVLKASSAINAAFSACNTVGNNAKSTTVLAALSASKFSQADGSFELIAAVAAHMYTNSGDSAADLYSRVKVMKLLASMCTDLSKAGKPAKKDINAYLEVLCPLIMCSLDRTDSLNAAAQLELLGIFDSFVALSAAPIPATNSLSFAHIGARVVVKVLSAESTLVVKQLGVCLQAYCPENAWKVLLQIALTTGQDRSSSLQATSNYLLGSKTDQSAFSGLSVRVEAPARTAALRALSAGITAMLDSKKMAFDAAESTLLVSLVPVVLRLCGDVDAEQRSLGLVLASRLNALNAGSKFVLASKSLSADAVAKGIRTVAALITGRASIIAVEPFACASAVAADVFESKDASKLPVASFLCVAALEFGWTHSAQINAVFSAATQARLDTTWPFLKQLIQSAPNETEGHSELAITLSKCIRLGYTHASAETQKAVVQWVTEGVSSSSDLVKQLILSLIEGSLFADASAEVRSQLFEALMNEQVERPGQKVVISALQVIQVELSLPARLLREQVEKFQAQYQVLSCASAGAANSTAMVVDDDEDGNDGLMSGLSAPLQRILSLLESLNGVLMAASAENDGPLMGFMSANLLDLLALLNESRLRSVMLVDYCKALLVETVYTALSVAGSRTVAADNKKSTSGAKKGAAIKTSADKSSYSPGRVEGDIRLLLSCITSTKATQVQTAALKLLKVLLHLNPATVMPSMQVLGELLATSSANMQAGKEGLIEQILKTFVAFLPTSDAPAVAAPSNECVLMPQYMLQSLCQHFYTMPHHRRSALLKMALSAMKAPSTLAVAVDVLLVHSFAAHETDTVSTGAAAEDLVSDEAKSEALILLSKSAHRRAHREMKSSVPEELFNLANELMLARAPNVQVSVIISLLSSAHRMLEIAIIDGAATSTTARDALDILDIESTFKYCTTLFVTNAKSLPNASVAHSTGSTEDNRRGHAATLAILHLELIIELLENKAFHQMLVSMLDAQAASGLQSAVQEYFMSFADSVLQLLAMTSAAEQGLGLDERQKQPLRLRIGGTVLRLAPRALGKHVSSWCYEALHTLQKLMDGPSFVAIIQELIDHEKLDVRQKALVILGDRLESMTATKLKSDAEIDLYLDLNAHLRKVVQSFVPLLRQSGSGEVSADFYQQSGLAQSALMCIDVLARFLGTRLDWTSVLNETLLEVVDFGAVLSHLTGPEVNSAEDATPAKGKKSKKSAGAAISSVVQAEHLKLLGSSSLCVATLSSVLGAQALSSLPTIMGQNLSALEHIGTLVVAGPGENAEEDVQALWRTRVLLVRSEISAVSIIVAQLSNFSHPYIPRILSASLVLEGMNSAASESALVRADVDRCLSTIATKIPTRLSVPLFLQSAPTLLAAGHSAACRFADLMAEVWQQLDRTTVVAHMGPLSTLATLLLDYRRAFGDQTAEANEVDAAAADAVVEMCLKLTESELKSFLARLAEWRDVRFKPKAAANGAVESAEGDWRKYSRAVSYFSLADVLMSKLKSLFNPMMAMLWSSAVDILANFASTATAAAKSSDKKSSTVDTDEDGKKSKKRKQSDTEDSTNSVEQSRVVVELELVAKYVLSGVRECCAQDNGGFVEEARFEKMMPAVVALVPLLRAFSSEAAYLTYMEDYVGACLAALTVAVGRDLLWKPLNHKILLLTRDPRKAVRIAAVKILHRLFSEVSDEYLLLLPECLPFLSELMEDSSREVVAATSEAISFIEELSGEKLDELLQ